MAEITVGADPEFFLFDKKKKMNISAHDKVPGNKKHPYKLRCGALQADGTAVEFNINPASSPEQFARNIRIVLNQVRRMLAGNLEFEFSPCVYYRKDYFDGLPEFSKELGCDPDFDSINEKLNVIADVKEATNKNMRVGGGHLHIGWTNGADVDDPAHQWDAMLVGRKLDQLLYPVSHLWEEPNDRRTVYGKRGAIRFKPYGVEYRTLSNAWLQYPKLWPWLFKICDALVKDLKEGKYGESHTYYEAYLLYGLNNYNVTKEKRTSDVNRCLKNSTLSKYDVELPSNWMEK